MFLHFMFKKLFIKVQASKKSEQSAEKKGKHQREKTISSETSLLCWSHIVGWGSSSLVKSKMNEVTPYKFSIWVTRVTTALLEH